MVTRVFLTGEEAGVGLPLKSCCPSSEREKGPYPGRLPPVIVNPVPIDDGDEQPWRCAINKTHRGTGMWPSRLALNSHDTSRPSRTGYEVRPSSIASNLFTYGSQSIISLGVLPCALWCVLN